jgi:hypothetical protein
MTEKLDCWDCPACVTKADDEKVVRSWCCEERLDAPRELPNAGNCMAPSWCPASVNGANQ